MMIDNGKQHLSIASTTIDVPKSDRKNANGSNDDRTMRV